MEIKESERIVVAKPVASRPTCSSFRSFSELLAGAINASPPTPCPETSFAAIRPKTVRFKPVANRAPIGVVSSQVHLNSWTYLLFSRRACLWSFWCPNNFRLKYLEQKFVIHLIRFWNQTANPLWYTSPWQSLYQRQLFLC